jgi:hypothetical protein
MFLQKGWVGECTGHARVSGQLIAHIRRPETVPDKGEKPDIINPCGPDMLAYPTHAYFVVARPN